MTGIRDTDSIPLHGWRTVAQIDAPEEQAKDYALIVATCMEVICDCPDKVTRLQAARLLANLQATASIRRVL